METTFENAQVGDKVWSFFYGWGVIDKIKASEYPICVDFDSDVAHYTFGGSLYKDDPQSLFWDEIDMTPPPRPVRKVKVPVEVWANIYLRPWKNAKNKDSQAFRVYDTKEAADTFSYPNRLACVKLTGEYEVEE